MADTLQLVPINGADSDDWLGMRIDLYGELEPGAHEQEMPDILSRDDWHLWFVEDSENERIGMVELSLRNVVDGCLSSPVPYVEGLYIVQKRRNQGLGTQLMKVLFNWASERGYQELALNTELTNTDAQRLYQTLGFSENERVVEYRIKLPNGK